MNSIIDSIKAFVDGTPIETLEKENKNVSKGSHHEAGFKEQQK